MPSTKNEDYTHRILQAWTILRDNDKRKLYDTQLEGKIKTSSTAVIIPTYSLTLSLTLMMVVAAHKEKVTINADVDLDDMEYEEQECVYSLMCRCSGYYVISENDLELGNDVICCDNCSLRIRVLYDVVEDDD